MADAREMLDGLKEKEPEKDPFPNKESFPTIRESLAELGANPDKYEKILAKTDEKMHWEKVFRPKTTLEAGAITLLAAAKQSGAEPNEYLSRLAPYFDSRIRSLPDMYNVSGYVHPDEPNRAVMTRTAREMQTSGSTLPHELEHTLQGFDKKNVPALFGMKPQSPREFLRGIQPESVERFGIYDRMKADLLQRLDKVPEEEREEITTSHPVFGQYLSSGKELFARIRAKDMLDSAKGEDFLQTDLGQKLFPTDKDRAYFIGSTLPGVPTIAPPYDFESTEQNRKPLTDPNTSYARQMLNKLTAPKEYQEGGEVKEEASSDFSQALAVLEENPSKYKAIYQFLLTKGDLENLNDNSLTKEDVSALGIIHAARLSNTEPETFIENLRPALQELPSRAPDVRPSVMVQGSSGGFNTRMPGMNFDMPYVPENLQARIGAEADVGQSQVRAGLVGGAMRTPATGVRFNPVMADVGFQTPVAGGTLNLGVNTGVQNPSAKNTNFMANYTRRFQEGGEVTEFPEEALSTFPAPSFLNSPVIEATPQSAAQQTIGALGGYMDQAGQFVSKSLEPIAEKNPVRNFLVDMFVASPLKSAGTALQDYTKTSREITEEQPYMRAPLTGSGQTLKLDPRMLDVAGFSIPAARGATKLASVGTDIAKEALPYVKNVAEKASDLYQAGKIPGMPAPNAYMAEPSMPMKVELPSSTTAREDLVKVPKAPKVLAPANEQGFYSATEAAALNLQRKSGSGQAFLNDIMKGENVRSEEVSAMGLDTFLKDKKNVTTAEVQDYIAQNKLGLGESSYGATPNIKWTDIGGGRLKAQTPEGEATIYPNYFGRVLSESPFGKRTHSTVEKAQEDINTAFNKPTKFGQYQLPGGENYREIVLTLPDPKDALLSQVKALGITKDKDKITVNDILQRGGSDELAENWLKSFQGVYKTRHWEETNPISHLRVSDRVTDGKKTLLVDEVQSDWHQAARDARTLEVKRLMNTYNVSKEKAQKAVPEDFGYKGGTVERAKDYKWDQSAQETLGIKENDPAWVAKDRKGNVVGHYTSENAAKTQLAESTSGVPDAPYKEDWYQLTLRRAIKEAIDGGYDRVALPTGARVAERFDLSKQVDRIVVAKLKDGTFAWNAQKDGRIIQDQVAKNANDLSLAVGKDLARKAEAQTDIGANSIYEGDDLRVGGEGMKKYYDEIYPGYLKKFGKKYGAGVGNTTVDAGGVAEPLRYMDITPKMREEFTSGIPMRDGGEVRRYL